MWSTVSFTENVARCKITVLLFETVGRVTFTDGTCDNGGESSALETRGSPGSTHLYSVLTNGNLIGNCQKENSACSYFICATCYCL